MEFIHCACRVWGGKAHKRAPSPCSLSRLHAGREAVIKQIDTRLHIYMRINTVVRPRRDELGEINSVESAQSLEGTAEQCGCDSEGNEVISGM